MEICSSTDAAAAVRRRLRLREDVFNPQPYDGMRTVAVAAASGIEQVRGRGLLR